MQEDSAIYFFQRGINSRNEHIDRSPQFRSSTDDHRIELERLLQVGGNDNSWRRFLQPDQCRNVNINMGYHYREQRCELAIHCKMLKFSEYMRMFSKYYDLDLDLCGHDVGYKLLAQALSRGLPTRACT